MKRLRAWLVVWVGLWFLWLLLAGEWNRIEWVAAACGATVAATIGEIARTRAQASARVPLSWIGRSASAIPMVFVDFAILVWALLASVARREIVRGSFRSHEFPVGGGGATAVGVRAWVEVVATYSPNAYVVEIEPERQLVLVHRLVPYDPSESPAT